MNRAPVPLGSFRATLSTATPTARALRAAQLQQARAAQTKRRLTSALTSYHA